MTANAQPAVASAWPITHANDRGVTLLIHADPVFTDRSSDNAAFCGASISTTSSSASLRTRTPGVPSES